MSCTETPQNRAYEVAMLLVEWALKPEQSHPQSNETASGGRVACPYDDLGEETYNWSSFLSPAVLLRYTWSALTGHNVLSLLSSAKQNGAGWIASSSTMGHLYNDSTTLGTKAGLGFKQTYVSPGPNCKCVKKKSLQVTHSLGCSQS